MLGFSSRYIHSKFLSKNYPVFLFHSIRVEESIKTKNLHEISIETFKKDILWLNKNFDIVSIDNLVNSKDKKGKAAITFDDGYRSIFELAIPFLIENKIPSTVFLNGSTVDGKVLWRDKVRYLINSDQVENFCNFLEKKKLYFDFSKDDFYCSSKSANVNSNTLNGLIDEFFTVNSHLYDDFHITDEIVSLSEIVQSEYVSYGNHGFSHYLMSSLSYKDQLNEVLRNEVFFRKINLKMSKIFSIPFGGNGTYDKNTLDIMCKNNYQYILLSRNRLNIINTSLCSPIFIERFMPQDRNCRNLILIIKMILKNILTKYTLKKTYFKKK